MFHVYGVPLVLSESGPGEILTFTPTQQIFDVRISTNHQLVNTYRRKGVYPGR